ncbi:hypothetical protein IV102_08180 [bacterium]|nr:hypothetical protein [bacterium]
MPPVATPAAPNRAVDAVVRGLTLSQPWQRVHWYRLLQQWKPPGILPALMALAAESDPHAYLWRLLLLDHLREADSP